jgi:Tol biopolymer transport system component
MATIGTFVGICCRDATNPDSTRGLSVVAAPAYSDTIWSQPTQPLVVVVRDPVGRLLPGVTVRFSAPAPEQFHQRLWLAPAGTRRWATSVVDTTDSRGQAQAAVRFGDILGTAEIEVTNPAVNGLLVVPFTVLAGAPARVVAEPADSAAYAGARYQIRTTVQDRLGNPREGATYTAEGPVSVSAEGVLSAVTVGRGRVVVRALNVADTVSVSVVPRGTIAAAARVADIYAIATFELDGSGYRLVRTRSSTNPGSWAPMWSPDGSRIAYAGPYPDDNIYVVDLSGAEQLLAGDSEAGWRRDRWPEYTRDGSWVYFGVSMQVYSLEPSLWRVRTDGSAPEMVTSVPTAFDYEPAASPSPDGRHVVFAAAGTMWLVDAEVRSTARLPTDGYTPRWSPSGNEIAFVGSDFRSVRISSPDGSQERTVASGQTFGLGLGWSPDGQWIVARGTASLVLLRVEDGTILPLAYAVNLVEPSWRP